MVITNITTTPVTVIPSSGGCPDGFQPFGDRCYGVFGGLGEKSWQDALTDCRQKSTPFLKVTLAAITSERENGTHKLPLVVCLCLYYIYLYNLSLDQYFPVFTETKNISFYFSTNLTYQLFVL